MFCPGCRVSILEVKNGYYFCPSCKILIGKVEPTKISQTVDPIAARQSVAFEKKDQKNLTTPPKNLVVDKPIYDKGYIFQNILNGIKRLVVAVFIGYFVLSFLSNFYYLDFSQGCRIWILPSLNLSNSKIKAALEVLRNGAPKDYKDICARVDAISPNVSCGGFEGGCFEHNQPRTVYVDNTTGVAVVAMVIVHETCHAKQLYEKRPASEPECYGEGYRVMNELTLY